jgi:hypothetical protein
VYEDRVVVAETKDSTELLERSLKNDYQYFRDLNGTLHYRAAEQYFAERGMAYELISTADLPPRLVGNLRFLEEYTHGRAALAEAEIDAVRVPVDDRGFASIDELVASGVPADHVYRAIVERHVYYDLEGDNLTDALAAVVYTNKATRDAMRLVQAQQAEPPPPIPGTLHLRSGGS